MTMGKNTLYLLVTLSTLLTMVGIISVMILLGYSLG